MTRKLKNAAHGTLRPVKIMESHVSFRREKRKGINSKRPPVKRYLDHYSFPSHRLCYFRDTILSASVSCRIHYLI